MHRARSGFFVSAVACVVTLASCGSDFLSSGMSPVEFDPNPAPLSAGVCVSTALFRDITGETVSVLSATVTFTDEAGTTGEFVFDADALAAILDSLTVPANGFVTGSFSFDLASKGLTAPCEGYVVAVGAGNMSAITNFVGTLRCEGTTPI